MDARFTNNSTIVSFADNDDTGAQLSHRRGILGRCFLSLSAPATCGGHDASPENTDHAHARACACFSAAPLASHKGLRHQSVARKMHYPSVKDYGRLIPAPAGSFACITDGPPRPCNQNIWVYGY